MAERETCVIEGCPELVLARSWCVKHYQRWRRWGDPLKNPATPFERLMAKVEVQPCGCWLWTGSLMESGYGMFRLNGHATLAHRAAWELLRGPIPEGFVIDHLCRVRPCVNPEHLEPCTLQENVRRGARNGRDFGAAQARKTHCPAGHPYDEANTYTSKTGKRHCKRCQRERDKAERTMVKALKERVAELEAKLAAG